MLTGSLLFVGGFAVVFVLAGTAVGGLAGPLQRWQDTISVVLGVLLVLLGLVFAGVLPWLQKEWRIHRVPAVGLGAAPVLGALFAIGWTPCIGPTFGVIVNLTYADGGTAARGALLALVYALGLGIPFVVAAVAYERTLGALRWVRRHQVWVMRIGGALLVVVGLLMLSGAWNHLVQWVQLLLVEYGEAPL
jgi:cytochrome c-type biogenesis protein